MKLALRNETDPLEAVILGIGEDRGEPVPINPVMQHHLENGTYPTDEQIIAEVGAFEQILISQDIEVFRPENLEGTEQMFTRDIGFVIDDKFVIANMKKEVRMSEIGAIEGLIDNIHPDHVLSVPAEATIEGGDVMLWNDYVFIGESDRTNRAGIEFIQQSFPDKEVIGFALKVTDQADTNVLHLDCTFQPVGPEQAIFYEDGFTERPDAILDLFAEKNLLRISAEEKARMFPNVFSIAPDKVVIEKDFVELKTRLLKEGYHVFEVPYSENAKLGGLLRCSTLPLRRTFN